MNELIELFTTIQNKKGYLGNVVYLTLKEAIITGMIPQGYRIKDIDIAQLFNVSRGPVREALSMLKFEGFLKYDTTNKCIVRTWTVEECIEIVSLLRVLRSEAIRLLEGKITNDQIDYLLTIAFTPETVREFKDKDQLMEMFDKYQAFYVELAKMCGNEYIYEEMKHLEEYIKMMRSKYPRELQKTFAGAHYAFEHRQILDSLRGDGHLKPAHEIAYSSFDGSIVVRNMYSVHDSWRRK